jgi:LAS superfamily LD-carboxypeptidase LdcB
MQVSQKHFAHLFPFLLGISGVIILVLVFLLYRAHGTSLKATAQFSSERSSLTETISAREARIAELETLLTDTKAMLEETVNEREELEDDLNDEKDRNEEFEDQIEKIGSTVGTLDKLAKTDPELLQKYSKVYFLNEHYTPAKLTEIPNAYVYREGGDPEFLHGEAYPFFKDMVLDALEDGVKLWVVSAYRSFDEQRVLKGAYTITYGSGANAFSADQGYSEHQLGTTVDFTTENRGGALDGFEVTPAYTWLTKNAYKYGFVLSYPEGNAYYVFEPWHWRFVGTDLAKELHSTGKYFYDMDQREIDAYLISLFD